jgi:hypothetical protein
MRKIYIIISVLAVITLIFFVLNLNKGDNSRTQLDGVFNTDNTIAQLSDLATKSASIYSIKVASANISATAASDAQSLSAYYNKRYRKIPKVSKPAKGVQSPADKLKAIEAGADFDAAYKDMVRQQLETNISTMKELLSRPSAKPDLKDVLNAAIANQTSSLQQLEKLP